MASYSLQKSAFKYSILGFRGVNDIEETKNYSRSSPLQTFICLKFAYVTYVYMQTIFAEYSH
jgi:hypothetical protein